MASDQSEQSGETSDDDGATSAFCPQPTHGTKADGTYCGGHCGKVAAHPNESHACNICGDSF